MAEVETNTIRNRTHFKETIENAGLQERKIQQLEEGGHKKRRKKIEDKET